MSKPKKDVGGRPTKYKPEYDDLLLKHLEDGYSFETFVHVANVCTDTLYEWLKVYPSFSVAQKRGFALGRYYWEDLGKRGINGKIHGFNVTGWIFMMKNRYKWHDNVRIETKQDPEDKSKDDQIKKLSEHLAALKELASGLEQV